MKAGSVMFAVLLFVLAGATAREITTLDGVAYKNVVIVMVEPTGLRVTHDDGAGLIDFMRLSPELQKEFGFTKVTYTAGIDERRQSNELNSAKLEQVKADRMKALSQAALAAAKAVEVVKKTVIQSQPTSKQSQWYQASLERPAGDVQPYQEQPDRYGNRDYSKQTVNPSRYSEPAASGGSGGNTVYVQGYYRSNGTYVRPHTRRK